VFLDTNVSSNWTWRWRQCAGHVCNQDGYSETGPCLVWCELPVGTGPGVVEVSKGCAAHLQGLDCLNVNMKETSNTTEKLKYRKVSNLLKPSGHYMYRTVVTVCTAQRSLHVPHSRHYMYCTVVTVCTTQRSLYVPKIGHCKYRTAVTICTAKWSLYVPHSGHYMYRTVVAICTTSLTFNNSTFSPHSVFTCFVWISEQTAIISLYSINWLVGITEM